jgi:Phytanoyl-CoA dioxygenase (PhyH)
MLATKSAFKLDAQEQAQLARDGLVVRENVFDAAEVRQIAQDCEDLVRRLEAARRDEKRVVGSYMFEALVDEGTVIKWEPNAPDVMQGIEPFAHICEPLRTWGLDPRMVDPCKAIVGQDDIILFTEKLNVKRARFGGDIVLHQDFPYWEPQTPIANRVATAMVFLDDADQENGCLEVATGTHTSGKFKQRQVEGFGSLEMDMDAFDLGRLKPLEVKAGTVAFFGAFLVHRSLPNHSSRDRRALLYSYQPAGHPHAVELHRLLRRKSANA